MPIETEIPAARSRSQRKTDVLGSRTAKNLIRAGWVRGALGPTRDVVIIEGQVEAILIGANPALEEAHARVTGFDPRTLTEHLSSNHAA